MTADLAAPLWRRKPERRRGQLRSRLPDKLQNLPEAPWPIALVPDTNVYIANAAGTLPAEVEDLLARTRLFHCVVCLTELAAGAANGDPRHPQWQRTRDYYSGVIAAVPTTRLLVPDRATWIDAGVLAGILARTQGYQPYQRKEALADALILLTAARNGLPVLTANRDEFDLLQQLAPECRFYHYAARPV